MQIQDSFFQDGFATFRWEQEHRNRCSFESFRIARELIYDYVSARRDLYNLATDDEVEMYAETMLIGIDNRLFHADGVKIMIVARVDQNREGVDISDAKRLIRAVMATIGSFGKLHLFY